MPMSQLLSNLTISSYLANVSVKVMIILSTKCVWYSSSVYEISFRLMFIYLFISLFKFYYV